MRIKTTFISILLIFPFLLGAQNDKDFLLTMDKDTIYGDIKVSYRSGVIVFRQNRKKTYFHASTIDYFGIHSDQGYEVFKTLENNWGDNIFVRVLSEGKINLYFYDTMYNDLYTSADPFRYYIGSPDIYPIRMSPRSCNGLMKMMIKDSPQLLSQLREFEDVPRIIKKYNQL